MPIDAASIRLRHVEPGQDPVADRVAPGGERKRELRVEALDAALVPDAPDPVPVVPARVRGMGVRDRVAHLRVGLEGADSAGRLEPAHSGRE